MLKILKSVQEHQKSMWYPEIEASIGRSLKKAKGEKEKEEKEENKYFLAFPAEGKNKVILKWNANLEKAKSVPTFLCFTLARFQIFPL